MGITNQSLVCGHTTRLPSELFGFGPQMRRSHGAPLTTGVSSSSTSRKGNGHSSKVRSPQNSVEPDPPNSVRPKHARLLAWAGSSVALLLGSGGSLLGVRRIRTLPATMRSQEPVAQTTLPVHGPVTVRRSVDVSIEGHIDVAARPGRVPVTAGRSQGLWAAAIPYPVQRDVSPPCEDRA